MVYGDNEVCRAEAMGYMSDGFFDEEDFCREDKYAYKCPICLAVSPKVFYINDDDECVGCSECVTLSGTP